jgi:hypothetical protein
MDIPTDISLNRWEDLSWNHFQSKIGDYLNGLKPTKIPTGKKLELSETNTYEIDWNSSSAAIASITLQSPVRLAVHAKQMIPEASLRRT